MVNKSKFGKGAGFSPLSEFRNLILSKRKKEYQVQSSGAGEIKIRQIRMPSGGGKAGKADWETRGEMELFLFQVKPVWKERIVKESIRGRDRLSGIRKGKTRVQNKDHRVENPKRIVLNLC